MSERQAEPIELPNPGPFVPQPPPGRDLPLPPEPIQTPQM
jgi:hypothetical protein